MRRSVVFGCFSMRSRQIYLRCKEVWPIASINLNIVDLYHLVITGSAISCFGKILSGSRPGLIALINGQTW